MSIFFKRLTATIISNSFQAGAVCGFVYLTDREYWNAQRLGYIAAFWMGAMMPIKSIQYGVNRVILSRLDLPNYNFFYMTNPKALFIDVSLNHLFFPFVQISLLFNYLQHALPKVFTPKQATSTKFAELREKHKNNPPRDLQTAETKLAQEGLKDILRFRIHLSAISVLFDLVFPRFNMSNQQKRLVKSTNQIVTDLTQKGKKITMMKTYFFTFIWNTYCINKFFQYHH